MKILVLSPAIYALPPKGYAGLERVVSQISGELGKRSGFDIYVAAPEGSRVPNCEVIETLSAERDFDMYRDIEILDIVEEKHGFNSFDLVWDNLHSLASFSAKQILRLNEVSPKVTATIHNHHSSYKYLPPRYPDPEWIFISDHQRRNMCGRLGLKKKSTIYNPVDVDEFEYRDGGEYFLFLSRISEMKGCHIIPQLAKRFPGKEFKMAGDTEFVENKKYVEMIKRQADKLDNLEFLGNVSPEKKVKLFKDAIGFLLPNMWEEPFGIVPVEAMASGTPSLISNKGALPELIKDGVTGKAVPPQMFDQELDFLDTYSPEMCRKHVEENFDIPVIADQYGAKFKEVEETGD